MPMPTNATYSVAIDWVSNGTFTDDIDDVTAAVLGDPGLTVQYGRDTARSTAPPMIGAADFVLNNQDRGFSPENPSTARYQFVTPGRPVRIRAHHGTRSLYRAHQLYRAHVPYRGVGVYTLLSGRTDTFDQHPEIGTRTVDVRALGDIARLKRTVVSLAFLAQIRTDSAVSLVLDAAGWPADMRILHVSDTIMQGYWADERTAWDCLVELLATEGAGAVMYEDGDGRFIWKNRNHRATLPRSATVQQSFLDVPGNGIYYTRLRYDPHWDDIVNRVTVDSEQHLQDGSPSVVWQLGAPLAVATGATQIVWARPRDPFAAAIAPDLTTDYTVAGGTVSVTLASSNGAVAQLLVAGLSGSPVVSGLQLRAYSFPVVGATQFEASIPAVDTGHQKTLAIPAWPALEPAQAQAIADSYLTRYQQSRPTIDLTFQNADGAALTAILDLEISDRVAITNAHLGLSAAEAYVEQITHRISTGGRHEVTLSCEPVSVIGSLGSIWDVGLWDSATWGV